MFQFGEFSPPASRHTVTLGTGSGGTCFRERAVRLAFGQGRRIVSTWMERMAT
jgi:hypothetical protein